MKKFIFLLAIVLAGCVAPVAPVTNTSTPEPLNPAVDFFVEVQRAEATAKAIEATQVWIYGQLTATAQVKADNATSQAVLATQQAFSMQSTATHEAFLANQAATLRSFEVTSTSQAIGTATSYPQTATAQSVHATQTQVAWQTTATMDAAYGAAQATAAMGNAQSVELAVQRESVTNMTRAWLPWMGFAALMALITVMGIRWSKTRVVQRDAFGASPVLIMDGKVIVPDLMPGPALLTSPEGVEVVEGDQDVTRRAQVAQIVRSMPPTHKDNEIIPMLDAAPRPVPRIEVLGDGQMSRVILDEIEDQLVAEE